MPSRGGVSRARLGIGEGGTVDFPAVTRHIHSEDGDCPTGLLGTWLLYKNNNFDFYFNDFDGDVDDDCLDTNEPDNSESQLNFVF